MSNDFSILNYRGDNVSHDCNTIGDDRSTG